MGDKNLLVTGYQSRLLQRHATPFFVSQARNRFQPSSACSLR